MNSIITLLLTLALLPVPPAAPWSFAVGRGYRDNTSELLPLATPIDVGDLFWYDVRTDWAVGETRPLTITLDGRLRLLTVAGEAFCDLSQPGRVVCPEPLYERIEVCVASYGDGSPIVSIATYEGTAVLDVPMERHVYLALMDNQRQGGWGHGGGGPPPNHQYLPIVATR